MQIDALAVRLRPRTAMEAADLGVCLCQSVARSVYASYAAVAVPLVLLALATLQISGWLPILIMWWTKPWLDRTILFALSRAAFGQATTPLDVWRAQRQVWWSRWWFTLTLRRASPWRSFTEPVYQLEGLPIREAGARVRQVRRRHVWSALMTTQAFALAELAILAALLSLVFWLAPSGRMPSVSELLFDQVPGTLALIVSTAYALTILFLEPFFVAAGFAMYLNRRAELEAWDIEQEFRRAFAH